MWVGGRPDYWANIGIERIARIELINRADDELNQDFPGKVPEGFFLRNRGDARSLTGYGDKSVDLVHSDSVIEHVGNWQDMRAMAEEMLRVDRAGWMQTPAWEFPFEPHFRAPFLHWFGQPLRTRMLAFPPNGDSGRWIRTSGAGKSKGSICSPRQRSGRCFPDARSGSSGLSWPRATWCVGCPRNSPVSIRDVPRAEHPEPQGRNCRSKARTSSASSGVTPFPLSRSVRVRPRRFSSRVTSGRM